MILLFCKYQGKPIYQLTAKIQVAVGCVIKLRTLPICKKNLLLKKADEGFARCGGGCLWKIFDSSLPQKETMSTV